MRHSLTHALIAAALVLLAPAQAGAQISPHVYRCLDIETSNVWADVGSIVLTSILNVSCGKYLPAQSYMAAGWCSSEDGSLKGYDHFGDYEYDDYGNKYETEDSEGEEQVSGSARCVFNNLAATLKLGYQTNNPAFINYAVYGTAGYNIRQLHIADIDCRANAQRFQVGAGAAIVFGGIQGKARVVAEGGIRYYMPSHLSAADYDYSKSDMNSGLASRYEVKLVIPSISTTIGGFVELMHYDLFKDSSICGSSSKLYTAGLVVRIFNVI